MEVRLRVAISTCKIRHFPVVNYNSKVVVAVLYVVLNVKLHTSPKTESRRPNYSAMKVTRNHSILILVFETVGGRLYSLRCS